MCVCVSMIYLHVSPPQSSHAPKVDPLLESHLAESRKELAILRDKNQHLQDHLSAMEVNSIKVIIPGVHCLHVVRSLFSTLQMCTQRCVCFGPVMIIFDLNTPFFNHNLAP